jgi:hypothetical protein
MTAQAWRKQAYAAVIFKAGTLNLIKQGYSPLWAPYKENVFRQWTDSKTAGPWRGGG